MRKLLLILLLISSVSFAQTDEPEEIELTQEITFPEETGTMQLPENWLYYMEDNFPALLFANSEVSYAYLEETIGIVSDGSEPSVEGTAVPTEIPAEMPSDFAFGILTLEDKSSYTDVENASIVEILEAMGKEAEDEVTFTSEIMKTAINDYPAAMVEGAFLRDLDDNELDEPAYSLIVFIDYGNFILSYITYSISESDYQPTFEAIVNSIRINKAKVMEMIAD